MGAQPQTAGGAELFFQRVQRATEAYLTRRARKKRIAKEKQAKKHPVADWVEAFVWAACFVLVVNQYAVQAYQIPSGSMIDTLNIGDHIFVNKLIYGPELLPGIAKTKTPLRPQRNDVIIFDNPAYIANGPVFDIAQRVIYMLTIAMVDIDRDENGQPKAHFLIKRAVGAAGDLFVNADGEMLVRFAGEDRFVREREYNARRGWNHQISRLIKPEDYPALKAAAKVAAYSYLGVPPPEATLALAGGGQWARFVNDITFDTTWVSVLRSAHPHDSRYAELAARREAGWYIGEGRMFPLGDNRDNSHDGRYFGPVRESKVLGKGAFKYWPPRRIGTIK
ncbi:MAG: S26 family signal peptidase [Spirochaetaceae bacterium]|jgi:signal peptidase I|nr:S26 family signal peptidase [Spirochaetaceae bacterium]